MSDELATAPILTSAGAAKVLGLSIDMLRVLERQGKVHPLRTESNIRLFLRSHVEALAAERAARKQQGRRPR
jgi:DNA-binding transcriptional MerR regulator